MKIEELTQIEKSIKSRMPEGGHFEERHAYLSEHGLYEDWRSLFVQYANLALDGDLEAIKRALFFIWYQCAEPNQLSGINELDEDLVEKVLLKVDSLFGSGKLDIELTFMLPFYYQVAEWCFERFSGLENLVQASISNSELWQGEAPKVNWKNRGSMGEYWSSKGL